MDFDFTLGSISNVLILDPTNNALTVSGNVGVVLPVGTTLQRVNIKGALRLNSSTSLLEYYDGSSWQSPTGASGSTVDSQYFAMIWS